MTVFAPLPAHTCLAQVEPARASLQTEVIEALNRRCTATFVLRAATVTGPTAPAWIALEVAGGGSLHVAPLLVDGSVPALADAFGRPDAARAAAALGALEEVVAAIELVVGRALRSVCVVDAPGADDLVFLVEALAAGTPVHRLLLVVAADLEVSPANVLPLDRTALTDITPIWTARIPGPAITRAIAERIGAGDLLLLGATAQHAYITPPFRTKTLAARLDRQGGSMAVEHELEGDVADAQFAGDLAGVTVATSVEFDGGSLTLERLGALGVGSVVAIPGARGGVLPVRLIAGGRPVATGDLVAVGEGYGVLITALVPSDAAEG